MTEPTDNIVPFAPIDSYDDFQSQSVRVKPKRQPAKFDIALSEDHIAGIFATDHADMIRYDHTRGSWYIWHDTHWLQDQTGIVFDMIRQYCAMRAPGASTPAEQRRLTSVRNSKSVETFAQVDPRIAVTQENWNVDQYLIATPGGTVDLSTGEMRDPDPLDLITHCTSVAPAPHAICPIWDQFLIDCCNGDEEQMEFLQKMAGYALTGDTREHALFFIYGPGGNGKSVFLNILMRIMNDYAKTAAIETFTASHNDRHPTELATLMGARLVTASETEEGKRWAESRIKSLTGGDTISARFMRQDSFEFKPIFKLLIVGNHMPGINSVDDAVRRRFRLVPFLNKPKSVDKLLEFRLLDELPGIFRWAIEGCLKWKKEGLEPPTTVKNSTDNYFSEQDILQQWIEDRCELSQSAVEDSVLAYTDWAKFAENAGEFVGTKKSLTQRLSKRGIPCIQKWHEGQKRRCYIGLSLKSSGF